MCSDAAWIAPGFNLDETGRSNGLPEVLKYENIPLPH
jgi:hypothetical protein